MERYRKFKTSRQEPLRLSIALEEFDRESISDQWKKDYISYLHRRIRPALMNLTRQDDTLRMAALSAHVPLPHDAVDDALSLAVSEQKVAALVWLLRYKQKTTGYQDRDFQL